jgi:hypothetical protein
VVKPKVPKPTTVSAAAVKTHQRTLAKLERQLVASNRRNLRSVAKLEASQQTAQDLNTEQLSLLEKAVTAQSTASTEAPEEQVAGLRSASAVIAQAQSDTIESKAIADYRARQQTDAYSRKQLVNALVRNMQLGS